MQVNLRSFFMERYLLASLISKGERKRSPKITGENFS